MKNVAQALGHADRAAEKNNFAAGHMRLPHHLRHIFNPAVKPLAWLALHKKGRTGSAQLLQIHAPIRRR